MYDLDESQSCGDPILVLIPCWKWGGENHYSGSENSEAADGFRLARCHKLPHRHHTLVHKPTSQSDFYSSGAVRKYGTVLEEGTLSIRRYSGEILPSFGE